MRPSIPLTLLLILAPGLALAQVERSSGGNSQLLQQMQQLASERTQLQAENARLNQELDKLRKERDALESGRSAVEQRARSSAAAAARAGNERELTQAELQQSRTRMEELVGKFRETAGQLREMEGQRAGLASSLQQRDTELKTCVDRNLKLYELNGEVLTKLEKRSGFVSPIEPFTQLKRAENDNLIEDYRGRAEDQRATVSSH